ncbi:hypothetical protein PR202_gb13688 [Eleusine coracana subsp. coracana]|uniref:RBR-type E3 ubiquitin transferase n=1 Tax=Eleusine coracana subsp. coracana TaxID=191504 RepID=A0AAV5EUC5_ELECO|nr:hypothetical protein PR202_gb13688 [Eleusine coracana subsp. coracana]
MATADGNNDDDIYRSHGEETEDECEYGDDDDYDYADECSEEEEAEEEEEPDADEQEEEEQRYAVLTEADILALQDAATAEVAEVLSIPAGFAAILLRHLKWAPSRVKDEWFSDDGRVVRAAVGLPLDGGVVVLPVAGVVCGICFDAHPAGRMAFAACAAHLYCTACWRGYVRAAVEDGAPRCLGLRCPDPACHAAVARELVYDVARDVDKAQYANFSLRSYVEDSGGGVRWCPGPGCARAVQLLHVSGGGGARDVSCDCGHGFCFGCGEEAHRPVSCETVRAWAAKNASDSENANWVLTHTKLCPGCRKHIEKNQGCNHMTCRCGHQFCWLCFDPWGNQHTHCSRYYHTNDDSNDSNSSDKLAGSGWLNCEDEKRRRQAKASLDRYLYHYDRWASNKSSMEAAVADMAKLERSGLRERWRRSSRWRRRIYGS